jgi:hypothetical protein
MSSNISSRSGRGVAIALAGPVLQGAILGLRAGPGVMLAFALGLPAIVAAVTLLTTPTLYVGGAVLGRLSLAQVAASTGRALHALGLAMLGMAPLSLLLATTSALPGNELFSMQIAGLVVVALMMALHRLAGELDAVATMDGRPISWHVGFAAHTALAFILGARLFTDLLAFGERIAS